MSKEEIHHCPKCGGAAKIKYEAPYTWVQCKKCKFCGEKIPDYGTEERDVESRAAAIEDWNSLE